MQRLQQICAQIAVAAGKLFESPTISRYKAAVSTCYHYTRDSGPQLQRAADLAPDEDLRRFFAELADDERNHYRLAEADLAAFGVQVNRRVPPAVVAFAGWWYAIPTDRYFQLLGATYVLENLADRLRERTAAALAALGLGPERSRFVRTHLAADEEHGRRVAEMCEAYLPRAESDIVAGAETAARFWSEGVREFLAAE
jgi:hypothetical protein